MSWLKAIGWTIAFVLLGAVLTVLFSILGALLAFGGLGAAALGELQRVTGTTLLIQGAAMLAGFGLATWALGVKGVGLRAAELRWRPAGEGVPGFGLGLLAGAAAAAAALGLAALLGGARWSPDQGGSAAYAVQTLRTLAVLAPAALAEEVVFRGLPLVLVAAVAGRWRAVVLLAALFALAHVRNPNVSGLGIVNIALAGIFLGAAFYAPGGIWTAFGAHLGWNGALAALDAPVSGLPFAIPLIDYHAGGPAWLTGGAFGPEGGLTATIAIACAAVLVGRRARKEQP